MPAEKITFPGAGGEALAARLDLPAGPPRAFALFAHCFTCTKDVLAAARIAEGLAARGIATLRFDFTGLGHSEGDFANTGFSSNVGDLVAAADHMRATLSAPALLVGHSLGGAAVLAAAARIPEAVAVVTIGAPAEPNHVTKLLDAVRPEIENRGEAEVAIGGYRFRIRKSFLDDIAEHRLEEAIGGLDRALLVCHAPRDETVGIENASQIFLAARHPKSFLSLDDADHLLRRRADALYVAEVIAAWAGRFLPAMPAQGEVEDGVVLVRETGRAKLAQEIAVGRHRLTADEPTSVGGSDTGPTPYGLLSAALGACTSMTLRLYAERKGWKLGRIAVEVRHDRVHAEDCAGCEDKPARIDRFRRRIAVDGALEDEQRARLVEIAGKCPVHRTLEGEVRVETEIG